LLLLLLRWVRWIRRRGMVERWRLIVRVAGFITVIAWLVAVG
jgi:hypothetical protein